MSGGFQSASTHTRTTVLLWCSVFKDTWALLINFINCLSTLKNTSFSFYYFHRFNKLANYLVFVLRCMSATLKSENIIFIVRFFAFYFAFCIQNTLLSCATSAPMSTSPTVALKLVPFALPSADSLWTEPPNPRFRWPPLPSAVTRRELPGSLSRYSSAITPS